MNKYKLLVVNCGIPVSVLGMAYDILGTVQNSGYNFNEIIKVELVGTINEVDNIGIM